MKKQLANIITLTRVAAALFLFSFEDFSGSFLIIYTYCGISDFVDGPIARHFNASSAFGSLLDTLGDVFYYLTMVKIFIMRELIPFKFFMWFIATLLVFTVGALIGKHRFHKVFFVHTLSGKALGLCAFAMPFAFYANVDFAALCGVCGCSSLACVESLVIQAFEPSAQADVKFAGQIPSMRRAARLEKASESKA